MPTYAEIFNIWIESDGNRSEKNHSVLSYVLYTLEDREVDAADIASIRTDVFRLCSELSRRWELSWRMKGRFTKYNAAWLSRTLKLNIAELAKPEDQLERQLELLDEGKRGRPEKSFEESSERTKLRKTKELRDSMSTAMLTHAASTSLRNEGNEAAAKLIKEATETTPERAYKIRKIWKSRPTISIPYTAAEALSLLVETKLSKNQYQTIRQQAIEKNADIYPAYNKVRNAKEQCYPPKEAFTITDSLAEVSLQPLLDHTAQRLMQAQHPVISTVLSESCATLTLLGKWGFDGSSGHSEYKQVFSKDSSTTVDSDIFMTSFVPLQLYIEMPSKEKKVLWQNPRTSSTRYCRPIRIQFKKETTETSEREIEYIENQIKDLSPTHIEVDGKDISVKHVLMMTMIDGKVCNAVTSTSSAQVCYVCGASPKDMNKLDQIVKRNVDITTYRFGLSTLHAWIRFMEYFLHIAYRLDFKKWQARGEFKEKLKIRKKLIQDKFKNDLGLLIDKPKPGGSGTSNDGNTARRFFRDPVMSSSITGLNESVIRRSAAILQALSSGFSLNIEAFDSYAKETARMLVEEYPWFFMPMTVHKILIHGADVVAAVMLPIGQLSEEAQESRNKDLKNFREFHTRKTSRVASNEDLIHNLLISSDPFITSLRPLPTRKSSTFSAEAMSLLAPPINPSTARAPANVSSRPSASPKEESSNNEDSDDF